ncbi:MAG TPA: hypothetical protein PKC49_13910 [Phycisphaerae bacterium]|nr:hypothetical protein [Phycisphaerae bacterium]
MPDNAAPALISEMSFKNGENLTQADARFRQRAFLVGPNASGKSNFKAPLTARAAQKKKMEGSAVAHMATFHQDGAFRPACDRANVVRAVRMRTCITRRGGV